MSALLSPKLQASLRNQDEIARVIKIALLIRYASYPLWGRQIPYTMMKFASFETIVEMIYERLPGQKSDYSKAAQTGVSFTGGYLAGILCAIVSHPADVMVSKLSTSHTLAHKDRYRNLTPIVKQEKHLEPPWAASTRTSASVGFGMGSRFGSS